jgi:hypothetical protein
MNDSHDDEERVFLFTTCALCRCDLSLATVEDPYFEERQGGTTASPFHTDGFLELQPAPVMHRDLSTSSTWACEGRGPLTCGVTAAHRDAEDTGDRIGEGGDVAGQELGAEEELWYEDAERTNGVGEGEEKWLS